jgi:YVTN family beta-propeller protein
MRALIACLLLASAIGLPAQQPHRYLYVAGPSSDTDADQSIRILVFDIANGHRLVRRIALWPAPAPDGDAETTRGLAVSEGTGRLFISTTHRLAAIDLNTARPVWEKSYENHCCDRLALSPDGQTVYAPAFGASRFYVINAATGALRSTIEGLGWAREAAFGPDGHRAYLSAWESDTISVVDTATHAVIKTAGPFGGFLCPFTLNDRGTMAFTNVDGLVGFEVGDLQTGLLLDTVIVDDVGKDEAAQYECPSHGIAFTRDYRELWVADGVRNRIHVFDATQYPPALASSITLADQPLWIEFSKAGDYAYASTGDVIDAKAKNVVGALENEAGARVMSEQIVEIDSH